MVWCGVWSDTLEKTVCTSKTSPYRQHVHMCKHMWVWCRYTRGRFGCTHGEEGKGGHRQFCLPKFAHVGLSRAPEVQQRNSWMLPIFSLRTGREQHRLESSNHSRYMKHVTRNRSQDRDIHIYICLQIYICTRTCARPFHDVSCSKLLTFNNGFMFFLLLEAVSSTFSDFKPLQLRPTERKLSITRSWRQQRMCKCVVHDQEGQRNATGQYLLSDSYYSHKKCDL